MEYHDFAVLQLVQNAALPSIEIVQGPTYITATNRGGLG
jgi:hypothetical protein